MSMLQMMHGLTECWTCLEASLLMLWSLKLQVILPSPTSCDDCVLQRGWSPSRKLSKSGGVILKKGLLAMDLLIPGKVRMSPKGEEEPIKVNL